MNPKREIILNLYIFDENGDLLVVDRDENDSIEQNVVTLPILYLPIDEHPVDYIKKYLKSKKLKIKNLEMLKGIYLNKFDVEMEIDYLVFSFKIEVQGLRNEVRSDEENPNLKWMTLEEFSNHPKLMPEFRQNNFESLLEGKGLFYKGTYRESDGSFGVMKMINY